MWIIDEEKQRTQRTRTVSDPYNGTVSLSPSAVESFEIRKHRQRSQANFEQTWPFYRYTLKYLSQLTYIPSDTLNNYVRTLGFLLLLSLLFPINFFITIFTLICSNCLNYMQGKFSHAKIGPNSKRILISGGMMTKGLELCRAFHKAGHYVILIDEEINWLTGHQWSNSVRRFYVVPSAEKNPDAYIDALVQLVQKEQIDMFIPVTGPYHAHIDAQAKPILAKYGCETFHMSVDDIAIVDNKYRFTEQAQSIGLSVPKSFYITSRQQLLDFDFQQYHRPFICKSIMYDWLDRAIPTRLPRATRKETIEYINLLPISEQCPYILQEFISGEEFCTHGTSRNGELTLFTCCYSSAWQLNYKHIDHPDIFDWCTKYVRHLKLTGHPSFDFIVSHDDKQVYGIECNPRVHSAITAFYQNSNVAQAYFEPILSKPIVPLATARETYWITHELWRILRNLNSKKICLESLKRILYGKEAIWSWDDPLPYLLHYHLHIVYLLVDNLRPSHVRFFNKIDCCIGELS